MMTAIGILKSETHELVEFLEHPDRQQPDQFELIETRLEGFHSVASEVEYALANQPDELLHAQDWFRTQTDAVMCQSPLIHRIRAWPEGYPGDYITLEAIYANLPQAPEGVGYHLDRYVLSRTLGVAVRSRLRTLAVLLNERARAEGAKANWLNLACGPCRELLAIPPMRERIIWCLDADANALNYARDLLQRQGRSTDEITFLKGQALRLMDAARNRRSYGAFTTIYSTGFFDYVPTEPLIKLIGGLYQSLAPGGELIAAFKDRRRYTTVDYHWIGRWHYFLQRTSEDIYDVCVAAGIPIANLAMERDPSGVILFVRAVA